MDTLALPFASGATPVSSAICRKSSGDRPSARSGGSETREDWMYDISAFESVVMVEDVALTSTKTWLSYL